MDTNNSIDIYEKSDNDIAVGLGSRFKDYRVALRLTQKQVSEQSGVSVMTIVRFERGESHSIRLDNFIALMRAIQQLAGIANVIPEMSRSLYDVEPKAVTRVRRHKNEK